MCLPSQITLSFLTVVVKIINYTFGHFWYFVKNYHGTYNLIQKKTCTLYFFFITSSKLKYLYWRAHFKHLSIPHIDVLEKIWSKMFQFQGLKIKKFLIYKVFRPSMRTEFASKIYPYTFSTKLENQLEPRPYPAPTILYSPVFRTVPIPALRYGFRPCTPEYDTRSIWENEMMKGT